MTDAERHTQAAEIAERTCALAHLLRTLLSDPGRIDPGLRESLVKSANRVALDSAVLVEHW